MIRIIDGTAYEGKYGSRINVKAHDLGNGHLEFSGVRNTDWAELDWSALAIEHYLEAVARDKEERVEELAQKRLNIAAGHAKRRVRRLCKAMGVNTLLTLTYRANVVDLARCKADLKEFVRRLKRVLPDFRAVCCFERQERGAWHVHLATIRFPGVLAARNGVKVKSFNVIRAVWRSVTKDNGGNVDVSNTKRGASRSSAKIAAYIAKYISKAFQEGEAGSNRWTKFGNCDLPAPVDLGSFGTMHEVVSACYALVDQCASVVDQHLSRWDDWFFLIIEKQLSGSTPA